MQFLWHNSHFLGIDWHPWKVVGWCGNIVFFSRFIIQWYCSEKSKRVVIPVIFWWLSLIGTILLLAYSIFYKRDSVYIFSYAFAWIPYVRNLIIHSKQDQKRCSQCEKQIMTGDPFCSRCGQQQLAE